jgi:hypothetical protein
LENIQETQKFGNIVVVPFESWHLEWVDLNNDAFQSVMRLPSSVREHATALATLGNAYTGLSNGRVLGCVGVLPLWTGVMDLWMYIGKDAFKEKKQVLEILNIYMGELIKKYKIHRLQAMVKSDYVAGLRFAKFFGFESEGEAKQYGPNKENFTRVAKIL